ncbi:unnamed protein product [Prorocentrum cordatum]|uniref:Uncharacterized protein n=1 Tax=Prorocentrum cordatum TaxID=2364126 RepID=A0ABN9TE13_9DINO|nr:unnamed protein product [Polarella glacialis]
MRALLEGVFGLGMKEMCVMSGTHMINDLLLGVIGQAHQLIDAVEIEVDPVKFVTLEICRPTRRPGRPASWRTRPGDLGQQVRTRLQHHQDRMGLELRGPSVAMEPAKAEMQQMLDFYKGGSAAGQKEQKKAACHVDPELLKIAMRRMHERHKREAEEYAAWQAACAQLQYNQFVVQQQVMAQQIAAQQMAAQQAMMYQQPQFQQPAPMPVAAPAPRPPQGPRPPPVHSDWVQCYDAQGGAKFIFTTSARRRPRGSSRLASRRGNRAQRRCRSSRCTRSRCTSSKPGGSNSSTAGANNMVSSSGADTQTSGAVAATDRLRNLGVGSLCEPMHSLSPSFPPHPLPYLSSPVFLTRSFSGVAQTVESACVDIRIYPPGGWMCLIDLCHYCSDVGLVGPMRVALLWLSPEPSVPLSPSSLRCFVPLASLR